MFCASDCIVRMRTVNVEIITFHRPATNRRLSLRFDFLAFSWSLLLNTARHGAGFTQQSVQHPIAATLEERKAFVESAAGKDDGPVLDHDKRRGR